MRPEERDAFLRWLDDFEHNKLGLPRPDLVLYLDMPTDRAVSLLRQRESDTHTQADIHELDTGYLAACRSCALQAAQLLNWRVVRCVDEEGRLRPSSPFMRRSGPWRVPFCDPSPARVPSI